MLIIDKDINHQLKSEFDSAKKSIKIIAYSISRPRKGSAKLFTDTWKALEMAIKRGIKTQIILYQWNDLNPQAAESNKVLIYLRQLGADVRMSKKGVIMHSKTWMFDDCKLIIGSHNSTEAGLTKTKNLSVSTMSKEDTEAYRAYFNNEWALIEPMKIG